MREFSVPVDIKIAPDATLSDAVFDAERDEPDRVMFRRKDGDSWQPVTARTFAGEVRRLAAGLMERGVQPGDRVGLMSRTRYEWTLCDYAIWTAGAVTVPVYETSSAEQVAWILGDSGAVAVVVETSEHKATVDEVFGELGEVRHVWQIEGGALDELTEIGTGVSDDAIEQRRRTAGADTLATVIYTSGTTGRPKGCELTHGNFLFDATTTTDGLSELFTDDASTLLFLPLAHVFARIIQVGCVLNRVTMGHTADVKNLLSDFAVFRPTFILAVPRIFEKIYNAAQQKAHAGDGAKGTAMGALFDQADRTAVAYSEQLQNGRVSPLTKAQHTVFDRLVYSRLRAVLGGQVAYAVSGGGPLGARLGHFFRGIGVTILEGYGLTETTAGATCNLPHSLRIGTVGRPIPGETVRIGDDGEILLRGDNIFLGYWKNAQATAETLSGGWFHTGDIGELDADGFLTITGRKKELIVTAGGKNVSPAVLEDRLRSHPLISQCIVVGDNKLYIACLITLDDEALPAWQSEHGKDGMSRADLTRDAELQAEIQSAVDKANKAVSKAESIRRFTILETDFTEEGGQMTPTLKLKRAVIMDEFSADVEQLYA